MCLNIPSIKRKSMDQQLENLFQIADKDHTPTIQTLSDKVIYLAEEEFKALSTEQQMRQEEKEYYNKKIQKYKRQLKKCKNVRNPRLSHVNEKRREMRVKLKQKIALCEMSLQEIKEEEGGSRLGASEIAKDEKSI